MGGELKQLLFSAVFFCALSFAFSQSGGEGLPLSSADAGAALSPVDRAASERDARSNETSFVIENGAESPAAFTDETSIFALLRITLVLALVAAAVYGLVFFLKKQSAAQTLQDPYLKVLARSPISAKTACAIVSAGDKAWLVGLSDTNVSLISEITDKELVDTMLLDAANRELASAARRISFGALLGKFSSAFAKTKSEDAQTDARSERLSRLGRL